MRKEKSVTFRTGVWHDRDPEEARKLKMHTGHKVNIKGIYKVMLAMRYLDAISLECEDCCEVLLWYQEGDDVHTVPVNDTNPKREYIAKSAYDDENVRTRRGYLRN